MRIENELFTITIEPLVDNGWLVSDVSIDKGINNQYDFDTKLEAYEKALDLMNEWVIELLKN